MAKTVRTAETTSAKSRATMRKDAAPPTKSETKKQAKRKAASSAALLVEDEFNNLRWAQRAYGCVHSFPEATQHAERRGVSWRAPGADGLDGVDQCRDGTARPDVGKGDSRGAEGDALTCGEGLGDRAEVLAHQMHRMNNCPGPYVLRSLMEANLAQLWGGT